MTSQLVVLRYKQQSLTLGSAFPQHPIMEPKFAMLGIKSASNRKHARNDGEIITPFVGE